ncbi:MAG: IS1634 family transposase [Candidatus Thorarchaeota archaeon]|jgi:transposase
MGIVKVERLDHLGIISGVMQDLGIIEMIDSRIVPDEREEISTGEAVAGMVLNSLGFSNRPISLTPQFFENKAMDLLFRDGISSDSFNRFKLGRSLDKVFSYGCDLLFSEIALFVCQQEGIDLRFNCLDTTSFSLTGEYIPDSDEHAILVTHGYSKDHRPDLKQAVLELMVSQDGGIPFVSKSWDGNASDNNVFKERSAALLKEFAASPGPRYLVADSKLYTKKNAPNLVHLPFITRIPGSLKDVHQVIEQALASDQWHPVDEQSSYYGVDLCHYGIEQRWLVVFSEAAFHRASKTVAKAQSKEYEKVNKQLFHLQAQRFDSQEAAQAALDKIVQKLRYHKLENSTITRHIQYARRGKPTADTPIKAILWQIEATVTPDTDKIAGEQRRRACFVLGTNIPDTDLPDLEVIAGYKGQGAVERGFRFLKSPVFFVSSLFVKKPSRIVGLLMVMTLALLVYSVAQRRMRKQLESTGETIPNQINQPISHPTLRWIFQLLEGINRVLLNVRGQVRSIIEGVTELRRKILQLFGQRVCQIYQISPG